MSPSHPSLVRVVRRLCVASVGSAAVMNGAMFSGCAGGSTHDAAASKSDAALAKVGSDGATSPIALNECAAELKPLRFLAGGWAMTQPRGAMIEEHWSEPHGKSMMAMFQRVRGDHIAAFYEFSQIVSEPDGVYLRQHHVHQKFEADPQRKQAMVLKLESADGASATFLPVANAGTLAKITYTLLDPSTLELRVEPKPGSNEQPLTFKMTRVRPV